MPDIRIESIRKVIHSLTKEVSDERSLCDEWLDQLSEVIEDLASIEPRDGESGDCLFCGSWDIFDGVGHKSYCSWNNLKTHRYD